MPSLLKDLRVDEVSSVDRGAGEGVQIMLMKRAQAEIDAAIEAYLKREFSDDERKELASSGAALPDGSFPIKTEADLENAVHAYGRAKDKAKAKAHIISRAKTLGCTDKLPDGWVGKGIGGKLTSATAALLKSAWSIFEDKSVTDKAAALTETFKQFDDHIQDVIPGELEQLALTKAKEASAMTEEEKKAKEKAEKEKAEMEKAKEDCEKANKALAVAKREISVLKMSQKHKDYHANLKGDEKDKFEEMEPAERDAHMEKNPIEKSLPAAIQKQLDAAAADRVILKALQEKDEVSTFAKRAEGLGLQPAQGEILRKAYSGDAEAIKKLEQLMKGLAEQVRTGKVFAEFGSAGGGDATATAYEKLQKLAAEHRDAMIKVGKKCSPEQAFVKVYTDPANKALKDEHDKDEVTKRARFAA
jgi:hypothetical protein